MIREEAMPKKEESIVLVAVGKPSEAREQNKNKELPEPKSAI